MDILVTTFFVIICVLLILVVLLQKGRGGGLGAALGGAGTSAFGTRTGDVLTWVTIVLTALFLLLSVATTMVYRPRSETVMMPTFSPAPGPITEAKYVTIRCSTRGVKLFYTTDGGEPSEESTPYESAVRVLPGATIMARAYRTSWKPSAVAKGYYGEPAAQPTDSPPAPPPEAVVPGTTPDQPQ